MDELTKQHLLAHRVVPGVDTAHLIELIEEAEDDPDAEYDQPGSIYVEEAQADFDTLLLDEVPWGAIALRAHELIAAEAEEGVDAGD